MSKFKLDASRLMAGVVLAAGFAFGAGTAAQAAGTVILEGSDAIGYHCSGGDASACAYMNQTWSALGGSDARPIAVVGEYAAGSANIIANSTSHGVVLFSDLSSAGTLTQYAAIYFTGDDGCCYSGPGALAGRSADVGAYVNAGGTVQIGNYDGNSAWDFLVGAGGLGNAHVRGYGGGLGFDPGGSDGETVTALGLANGFTQPNVMSYWQHQAFDYAFFSSLGFTKSFYDSAPSFALPGYSFSSLLSNGNTITGGGGFAAAPEPATWAMMIMGLGGAGAMIRRRRAVVAA